MEALIDRKVPNFVKHFGRLGWGVSDDQNASMSVVAASIKFVFRHLVDASDIDFGLTMNLA